MTREVNGEHGHRDMQLISSSSSINISTKKPTMVEYNISPDQSITTEKNVSDSFITISNDEPGKNVTKTIEPLIKRIGQSQEKESKTDDKIAVSSISEKIDMAALAEKKRKKHQAVVLKKEQLTTHTPTTTTLLPGRCL